MRKIIRDYFRGNLSRTDAFTIGVARLVSPSPVLRLNDLLTIPVASVGSSADDWSTTFADLAGATNALAGTRDEA